MLRRTPRTGRLLAAAMLAVLGVSSIGGAATQPQWDAAPRSLAHVPPANPGGDPFAMAGGCYALRAPSGAFVARAGDGFAATAAERAAAEPFRFQATDLGRYLLFGSVEDFLAVSEGAVGNAAYAATRSQAGAMAGGVALEQTDRAADAVAASPANEATGRGARVVAAKAPSDLADWKVSASGPTAFTFAMPATSQALVVRDDGTLAVERSASPAPLTLEGTTGCAEYPEVEVNVSGPVVGGETSFQEVRGYFDAHLHMMAFEFLGGRARCGRPWHRFGVAYALVDCPDHHPGGYGAVLEAALNGGVGHHTDGWPTFAGWPRYNSLTHEQIYYKWLERAWRGGLRMFVNLLVDNNQLCKVYPYKRNSCNEMDGVRLQADRIRELERYIDAQHGGPGKGWFRIVLDPFEARRVINEGRLAVVLGIEVSVPLDCGLILDIPQCDVEHVDEQLDKVYELGVRQMELVNKFDNAFSGVAGDAGTTGIVVNQGNKAETGHYWRMETCNEHDGHSHDKPQMNFHDQSGAPDEFSGRDSLVGAILALSGKSGAAPLYPEGPHCNTLALSELGETMIRGMVERGIIFDPDHMSARARRAAVDLIERLGYSGIVSSHGWADDTIYRRIYELGGVVAPYAGSSTSFVAEWRKHKQWVDDRFYFGFAYGADTNGFGTQGGPRGASAPNQVTYPFTGFGGVTIDKQRSGTRVYNVNTDGVAHYGLYPDWIEDLRRLAGNEVVDDLARGPEAYLQMWERATGIRPDACRPDVPDLNDDDLARVETSMSVRDVLDLLGQPRARTSTAFAYCMTADRTATVSFTTGGAVSSVSIS